MAWRRIYNLSASHTAPSTKENPQPNNVSVVFDREKGAHATTASIWRSVPEDIFEPRAEMHLLSGTGHKHAKVQAFSHRGFGEEDLPNLPFMFRRDMDLYDKVIGDAHKMRLVDEHSNAILTLPSVDAELLQRGVPINPLTPFVQKIADRLPTNFSLQVFTSTSTNLIERAKIVDDLAFGVNRGAGAAAIALNFYMSLFLLQAEAYDKEGERKRRPLSALTLVVLENGGNLKEPRFRILTEATEDRLIEPQGLYEYETRAYLSLVTVENEEEGRFHYVLTAFWHEDAHEHAYEGGEDAVRYALSLLVSTVMQPNDLLYTTSAIPGAMIDKFFSNSMEYLGGRVWRRRTGVFSNLHPSSAPSSLPTPSPVLRQARPHFKPDALLQLAEPRNPSLETRSLETPLEINATAVAEQRAAYYPFPILHPGKTVEGLFALYLGELRKAGQGPQDDYILRANFKQWLRSKLSAEKQKRIVLKHEQRKLTRPPRPAGTLKEAL